MKSRKFITLITLLLILSMVLVTGCGGQGESAEPEETYTISEPINVAVMNGPTGMGMVDLLNDPNYNIEIFQAPTDALPKLISGEVDVACLPSNLAAVLYQKTEGKVVCVSPMVMGVLSILGNGVEVTDVQDLKGLTIVSAGQGGTPEYALQAVLEANGLTLGEDVQVTWLANHADVNAQLLTTPGTVAMVPEPFASVAQAKGGDAVTKLFFQVVAQNLQRGNVKIGLIGSQDFDALYIHCLGQNVRSSAAGHLILQRIDLFLQLTDLLLLT